MKNLLTILSGAILLTLSPKGFSQANLKIGHVDINEIMNALPARDSAATVLDKETKEMQATFDQMTADYNKLFDDYQKSQSTLTEFVKQSKEAELLDKEKRLQEFEQNATTRLQNRNAELIKPIIDKVLRAVNKVAAANGYTYILDVSKGSVVYTSKDSQDINPLVLKVLKP